jgi:hypothetical protein
MRDNTLEKSDKDVGLLHDKRGAVLAEFVVAIVPLLTIFFVFVQISAIAAARIRFKHVAIIGARAAAVFSNRGDNGPECQGDGSGEVTAAVRAGLGSASRNVTGVSASVNDRSNRTDPFGLVTVTVTGNYQCGVPLGKIICGGGSVTFTERKSMPHQGAIYRM